MTKNEKLTPRILKTAAMIVATPRYIGLMLFISGFRFSGYYLSAMHILEGLAGLALAILEGFAVTYILSRRQLGFSKTDTWLIYIVSIVLLISLPLCAGPYMEYLFDGTLMFDDTNEIIKFLWIVATVSMPILIIAGVALVENDPIDVQIMKAERLAIKKKTIAQIQCEADEIALEYDLRKKAMRKDFKQQQKQETKPKDDWLNKIKKDNKEEYDY